MSHDEINQQEVYYLPNIFNSQRSNYIKYGYKSVGEVLSKSPRDQESMVHQLEKLNSQDRKFVYYI